MKKKLKEKIADALWRSFNWAILLVMAVALAAAIASLLYVEIAETPADSAAPSAERGGE
jgi:LPS O-antigen subunit length determinant protein (WzzB/FepE family)